MSNVSDMPADYWAWTDEGKLIPLGICEGFDEADERAPGNTHWIFTREMLQQFRAEIAREISTH